MTAADPTYPLYPLACILSASMLLLVLFTSFIRQSWNLGVAFLCFWLFFETLTAGVDAIIWSDNADIKLYVYCDIVSRLQVITGTVKPLATLLITRRLYLIADLQSVELPDKAERRRNLILEWTLGLVIPLLVAGPLYYAVQNFRFSVNEGLGCENTVDGSVLSLLFIQSWSIIAPLISITVYYPRVVRIFYRQRRDMHFLQSNNSISRTNYLRILILASIDIVLTLPVGVINIVSIVTISLSFGYMQFYTGWTENHTDWAPISTPYIHLTSEGTSTVVRTYFLQWSSIVLAFTIFGLFGLTPEARASYWRAVCIVGGWFGWKASGRANSSESPLEDIEFGERPREFKHGSNTSDIGSFARVSSENDS